MQLLSHVNKRTKPSAAVRLPVRRLLQMFASATLSALPRNLALVYVEMGFEREPPAEQRDLALAMLPLLAKCTGMQQSIVVGLCFPALAIKVAGVGQPIAGFASASQKPVHSDIFEVHVEVIRESCLCL